MRGRESELTEEPAGSGRSSTGRSVFRAFRARSRRGVRDVYARVAREEILTIQQLRTDHGGTSAALAALELEIEELSDAVERLGGRVGTRSSDPELARFFSTAAAELGPTREERLASLRQHLAILPTLPDRGSPALDLGTGRAEWLELLADEGVLATGVDHDSSVVAAGRVHGLPAIEDDVLDHLTGSTDASCGLVTAFRLVEHLATAEVLELTAGARRVLRPGGALVIEAPDPRAPETAVGMSLDPSAPRARHPDLLELCARHGGFKEISVQPGATTDRTGVRTFVLTARA